VAVLAVLGVAGVVSYRPVRDYWKARHRPNYRLVKVTRGDIVWVINSTGTVKPVVSVEVGTFVSGPIEALFAEFNQRVKKDELLARIDPRIYDAAVARDRASVHSREADVARVQALLNQAENDQKRANDLHEEDPDFISETEMDQYRFNLLSLKAQLQAAEASVQQADANLQNSAANLGYTEIRSPVDGIVIDRKIEPGQTLAAQFQTPVLFVIAPEMEKKMHIFASVDETDIGLIRSAKRRGEPVRFTVDAYPDDLFAGEIEQIRISSTTTQNVVTYPVVVAAPNPDLKLLPGMTASLSFQIEEKTAVLKIPNDAFWFYPTPEQVRPEDRKILEGTKTPAEEDDGRGEVGLSATEKAEARRRRNRRHVWVVADEYVKAVEVVTGLSDNRHTELVSGRLDAGQELVAGIKPKGSEE